jgi:hypothetical protein
MKKWLIALIVVLVILGAALYMSYDMCRWKIGCRTIISEPTDQPIHLASPDEPITLDPNEVVVNRSGVLVVSVFVNYENATVELNLTDCDGIEFIGAMPQMVRKYKVANWRALIRVTDATETQPTQVCTINAIANNKIIASAPINITVRR